MKLKLFLSLFLIASTDLVPVAVSILLTIPHRYELSKTLMTWPAAQTYCRMNYTNLAIILSDTDWLRLKKETTKKRLGTATYVWVGLWNDVNNWRWSLGELPLKSVTYTNWLPGEPNNSGGKESCGSIVSSAQWVDFPCSELRPFICYNANFNVSAKFILITSPVLSWLDARAYCRQHHTDLASSLNSSDSNMLYQLVPPTYTWIGFYRDTWKWTDGTNASILWAPGQPDNYYGNENCAIIVNGKFYDFYCSYQGYFLCHTNFPTRSQMMRLQVKSDVSVFDPSSILDQIKQKLKENGMLQNTTVTWSVQPDGNIFHKKRKDDP